MPLSGNQPRVGQSGGDAVDTATMFMAVLALYLFGGEVLQGFSFAMLTGVALGTCSTIFIATGVAVMLSGRRSVGGRDVTPQTTAGH